MKNTMNTKQDTGELIKILQAFVIIFFFFTALAILPSMLQKSHSIQAASLNKTSVSLLKGRSVKLKVKNTSESVTWKSSKKKIATVNKNGRVTGLKSGTAKITATVGDQKFKCTVKVYDPGDVDTDGAMQGIDVSYWQGDIDFTKVKKAGIKFVIIRAGHGYIADANFNSNYTKAKNAGLKVGCYWYITASSLKALKKQASKCLKTIKGKSFDFPVFVDIESSSQISKGKSFCSKLVKVFCAKIKNAGYKPGWYTSRYYVQNYLTISVARKNGYCAWIAEYGMKNNYTYSYNMWQYSNTGTVNGISGYVDMDWYFPNP